ncbi:MAG: hypothetical protein WC967_09255 [Balneolaceae bacterium]
MYKRADFIPVVVVRKNDGSTFETPDLLSARYINKLRNLPALTIHTVQNFEQGRLDLISLKYYKRDDLWWPLALYNGIVNPIAEIITGKVLRIPSKSDMESALSAANTKQVNSNSSVTLR